jgi:hypothetical protein
MASWFPTQNHGLGKVIYVGGVVSKEKQILAQQPFLVKDSPFGISRHIYFFYEVGLPDQCPQPLLHERKTMTYLGFEPGTFGYQVGNTTN